MGRIFLFLATNAAVLVVFAIVSSVLGLDQAIGQSTTSLVVFAACFGFVGSFISLALSKTMAIRSMRVHVIEQPSNETERWLVSTIQEQARRSNVGMPDVGIFDSPTPNAFATGWNKNNALVAVSTGLLQSMSREEVDAVLGHEMAHVYNGDMVTMALLQGVLNTFVIIFSRILGQFIDNAMRGNRGGGGYGPGFFLGNLIGNVVFGVLASMIAAWFSRQREFRADSGGAELAGRQHMIGALRALQRGGPSQLPDRLAAFGINGGGKLAQLFSTHPPIDVRVAALEAEGRGVSR